MARFATEIKGELYQFIRALYGLSLHDFGNPQIQFGEIIILNRGTDRVLC